jgi:hexosaminidase
MRYTWNWMVVLALVLGGVDPVWAQQASELRLVPFPKQVRVEQGGFALDGRLVIDIPGEAASPLARLITLELTRAGFPSPKMRTVDTDPNRIRLAVESRHEEDKASTLGFREGATAEDYALDVRPEEIVCTGRGKAGLYYGVQTLLQLIRANRHGDAIPCLVIRDWPSLRWRCFQDDMTRGPSSKLDTLKFEVDTGAHLKMNLFTYYMEYQYAFEKHPLIGPVDGSLEPDDLKALVEYAKPINVDILGNQQSFGHLYHILKHDQYAHLRESSELICPVMEESYELLDDLYSEVCPLLPFPWFNVCCDETWDLGKGPSKKLADEIGVGGVYVRHIRRVHDLLKDKYGKRMMMWGDIILKHPNRLDEIPKDTIMLTWGYGAKPSFESQIKPFAQSGYEFFVCPGINNWNRILPDFGNTTTNIHNFVRDGLKLGALGMLNTAWEDDGEALNGYKWHGYAWGAECAWTGSATTPEDFKARIGAVLFGEKGDHFGQAIGLLSQTHRLAGMEGMNNRRFWKDDLPPSGNPATVTDSAQRLLEIVRPAIEHLEACKEEATINGHLLDYFLLGARRMEFIGQRMLDGLEACGAYAEAAELPAADALPLVEKAQALIVKTGETYEALGRRFEQLWLAESKPFRLDETLDRYREAVKRYADLAARLAVVKKDLEAGKAAPTPEAVGLALP